MAGQCRRVSLQANIGFHTCRYYKGIALRFPVNKGPDAPLVLTSPNDTSDRIKACGIFTLYPLKGNIVIKATETQQSRKQEFLTEYLQVSTSHTSDSSHISYIKVQQEIQEIKEILPLLSWYMKTFLGVHVLKNLIILDRGTFSQRQFSEKQHISVKSFHCEEPALLIK